MSFNCCNELKRVDVGGETCRDDLKSIDDDVEEICTGGLSLYDENASVYENIHDTSSIMANIILLISERRQTAAADVDSTLSKKKMTTKKVSFMRVVSSIK